MKSPDNVLKILENPDARILFIMDTTGSVMGTNMHEQVFEFLRRARALYDPDGNRTCVITDAFAHPMGEYRSEPKVIATTAKTHNDIPACQTSFCGSAAVHPLESISQTKLFKDYSPTNLVFVGDLFDGRIIPDGMPLPKNAVHFLMWDATPNTLSVARENYEDVGTVLPLFSQDDLDYLIAHETAGALLEKTIETGLGSARPRF